MAKETAIFWGMLFGQRCLTLWIVAGLAKFFCFFFPHGHKTFMILVMGQQRCGFRGRKEEKKKNPAAACQEKTIIEDVFLSGGHNFQ